MLYSLFLALVLAAISAWSPTTAFAATCMKEPDAGTEDSKIVDAIDDAIEGHNKENQEAINDYTTKTVHVKRNDGQPETKTQDAYAEHNKHDWMAFKKHKVANRCILSIDKQGGNKALVNLTYDFSWTNCAQESKQPMKGTLQLEKTDKWLISAMDVDKAGPTQNDCPDTNMSPAQTNKMNKR
jgi:hypothetical protein